MASSASRRAFLQRASLLSMAGAAAPWALNLAAMGAAAAATGNDYKALVCIFLNGGNDHANTVVPYDVGSHALYLGMRPAFAYDRAALAATALAPSAALPGGLAYALAPELAPLLPVFNDGQMAVMLNVGPLVQPTTKAQYLARSVPLPPKLFSHNDQQSVWQSSAPEGATSGWGGRMGDLLQAGNGTATFTCINVAGNAVFMSGRSAVQYQVSPSGPVALNGVKSPLFGSAACSDALRALVTAPSTHLLKGEYARVMARSLAAGDDLSTALATSTLATGGFPSGNSLADQLKLVARMITTAAEVGARRRVLSDHLHRLGVRPHAHRRHGVRSRLGQQAPADGRRCAGWALLRQRTRDGGVGKLWRHRIPTSSVDACKLCHFSMILMTAGSPTRSP